MLFFYLSLIETEEDKSKFEKLYYDYRKLMKYIAVDMLHDEFLAEDAVHEAFIKLTRYIKNINENDCHKTKSFIVIVIRSVCMDMLKKDKRDKLISIDEIEDVGYSDADSFENVELAEITSLIKTLPDTYRNIVELKVCYDLSDKEIADIIGIDNAALRKRIQRARALLRKKLAE